MDQGAATGDDDDSTAKKKAASGDDDDDVVAPTPSVSTSATATPTATVTATTAPPVVQPTNCANADPTACLQCCEQTNPGAVNAELVYRACLQAGGLPSICQGQHLDACAKNAACTANHQCMQINNCLASNMCQ